MKTAFEFHIGQVVAIQPDAKVRKPLLKHPRFAEIKSRKRHADCEHSYRLWGVASPEWQSQLKKLTKRQAEGARG